MRRGSLVVCAVVAAVVPAAASPSAASGPVLVVEGRGFGHGVGMAQDGAFWMGAAGASTEQILSHFYPGTTLGRSAGPVRVVVHSAPSREAVVTLPQGGDVRDAANGAQSEGFPLTVPAGGRVRLWFDGAYHAELAGQPPESPAAAVRTSGRPLLAVPADGGTVAVDARGRRYRGVVEANAGQGPLRLVNQLDVEEYLRGMGEVRDPSWPQSALRAVVVAERTYALRQTGAGGELCDDQRCQVYLGAQAEYRAMDQAVAATRGQVVLFRGQLAATVYSANGGGVSATSEEGFGPTGGSFPYLKPLPYLTSDPNRWTVRVPLASVAARFGYPGTILGVRVARAGPSGRALEVALDGDAGTRLVDGRGFDARLGLRSSLFTVRVEGLAPAPAPPPSGVVRAALDATRGPASGGPARAPVGDAPGSRAAAADDARDGPAPVARVRQVAGRAWLPALTVGLVVAGTAAVSPPAGKHARRRGPWRRRRGRHVAGRHRLVGR